VDVAALNLEVNIVDGHESLEFLGQAACLKNVLSGQNALRRLRWQNFGPADHDRVRCATVLQEIVVVTRRLIRKPGAAQTTI